MIPLALPNPVRQTEAKQGNVCIFSGKQLDSDWETCDGWNRGPLRKQTSRFQKMVRSLKDRPALASLEAGTGGYPAMLHYTCDHCGKELRQNEDQRFIIKIEAFAAEDPRTITEADLDEDHMEAVSELLNDMEESGQEVEELNKHFRYDLCHDCHKRFVQDPLGKDTTHKLFFSKN